MDRRAFIQLAGLTGVSLFAPWGFGSKDAHAAEPTWGGPYFLHMHAGGGWGDGCEHRCSRRFLVAS